MIRPLLAGIILTIIASTAYASQASNIEELLLSKDWKGVHSTLADLKPGSTNETERIRDLSEATKAVMNFFRYHDSFMNSEDSSARSYRAALNNTYNAIPRKLPFSQALIDEIPKRKGEADKRFVLMEEKERTSKEEVAAARRERERQYREAEARAAQEREDRFAQAEKERRYQEQYEVVRDGVEQSPEYQRLEVLCKICSAIEENKGMEKALATDAAYSRKYGVINLTRRDRAVQVIKRNDSIIREGKTEYKSLFAKPFASSACKKINCEECGDKLEALSKALTEKKMAQITELPNSVQNVETPPSSAK